MTGRTAAKYRALLLIVAILVFGTWTWFMDAGFCFSQWRYLTHRELIVGAIRLNASLMKLDGSDASIEKFLEANPTCCRVSRHPASRSLLDVVTGFNIAEVALTYPNPYPHNLETYYLSYIAVGSCGRAIKEVAGTGFAPRP